MAAEKVCCRQLAAEFGNVHRHHVRFPPRIDKRHLFVRFGVIDIVDRRHDDALVFDQIYGVVFAYSRGGAWRSGLMLPGGLQLCSMLTIATPDRLKNIVKRLQLEGLYGVLFSGGNETQ